MPQAGLNLTSRWVAGMILNTLLLKQCHVQYVLQGAHSSDPAVHRLYVVHPRSERPHGDGCRLVGAGGIGQELKGRYDIYNYSHVGTILVVIFITVFLLDQISARLRSRYLFRDYSNYRLTQVRRAPTLFR